MRRKKKIILVIITSIVVVLAFPGLFGTREKSTSFVAVDTLQHQEKQVLTHPLQIVEMRKRIYPGSEVTIEKEFTPGSTYTQYLVSYLSDGLKIYALLTIPKGEIPSGGFPVLIFNHGYIPPEEYRTTERYVAYVQAFARSGYIVFKPDYRGHGDSEGNPEGAYFSPAYTADVLNAVSSVKTLKEANPDSIGMWGHSMGGNITLRSMVVSKDIKAGVIWGGVVGSYEDIMNRWRRSVPWRPSTRENMAYRPSRNDLIEQFGDFESNPDFWKSISPFYFTSDVSGPIQLHHGLSDESVPWEFSETLKNRLEQNGKTVELFTYEGADHNVSSPHFEVAVKRSVAFFDTYLK